MEKYWPVINEFFIRLGANPLRKPR